MGRYRHFLWFSATCSVVDPLSGMATKPLDESSDGDVSVSTMTVLGFGSLLSEKSSRLTFPTLQNFRLGRVQGYRRVFRHTPASFVRKGIALRESMEMASVSAEKVSSDNVGFVCAVFEVPSLLRQQDGLPSADFREREEAFEIKTNVPYLDYTTGQTKDNGILCTSSSDEAYIAQWGQERFDDKYGTVLGTLWGWGPDSGLLPSPVYLRHCVLAAQKLGDQAYQSFLDETFLIDRQTTVRQYLASRPDILDMTPPPQVAIQYGGE